MADEKTFEKFTISQNAVLIKDNKCLIGEFEPSPGYWGLPGGRIDKGEEAEHALKRELIEEINLRDFEIITLLDYRAWYRKDIPRCTVMYLINADVKDIKAGEEFLQLKWVSEQDLVKYNFLWKHTYQAIIQGFKVLKEKNIKIKIK